MASSLKEQVTFHFEILSRATKKALDFLSEQPWMGASGWYLAGGTALALQTGHRRSVDLDFFTAEAKFNSTRLLARFLNNADWKTAVDEPNTVYGELFKAKVSFIAYPFFVPKQRFIRYGAINILSSLDIAVMKIIAISQRGRKRDFFDLYWCAKNVEPLEKTIRRLRVQYPAVAHDYHHILKSLVYFDDAEADPMPNIHFKATWTEIKKFFIKEVPRITSTIMQLD